MDQQRGIGIENRIPWRLRADLQKFKALTMGHHLIQGRKTWESIGRPLPGRTMIAVTRNKAYQVPAGVQVAHSLSAALALARKAGETEAFIGGGAGIYQEALALADRIYLTRVHTVVQADTTFPDFAEQDWQIQESIDHPADEKNEFPFTFQTLERKLTP